MAGLVARAHRPVVRAIGRRLEAASTPEATRRVIERASLLFAPCLGVTVEPTRFAHLDGLAVTPSTGVVHERAVLLLHGGGYVFASPEMYRHLAGRIAKAASATVYVPRYRLAPEHPYPAAIEDGLTAYRATLERVPRGRLVVGGDSAGGGMTLAVLQAARDEGRAMPAGMVLVSPWLDHTGDAASHERNADTEILIRPATVARCGAWYRGGRSPEDPGVSPLFGRLHDLPPMLVQVSSSELLYSDSVHVAEVAGAAGVEVSLEVADDLFHVWHLMAPALPEARASIASVGRFVVARTG